MAAGDVPESVYRNTLDLNRFSTGTSKKLVKQYDRIINDAIDQLARIERMPRAKQPKYKADRLRSLLKQLDASLKGWSNKSAAQMVKELDGITRLQSEFAQIQLEKALPNVPAVSNAVVNPLNVTKGYAESVVNSNPIDINASLLSDDLQAKVKGIPQKFSLTSKQGSLVNLPNGQNLKQAFRGLAAKQGELFGRTVRDGMLTGEPTPQLARRLRDQLIFEDGKPFKPNQVTNLVRTSVQQVSNDAAQAVYANNQDITKEYRWVATLDSRTAPECQILDQQKFKYGQGPQPPQHFGCRCRTVAELDYEGLGITPPKTPLGKRAAEGGSVPAGTSYGKWLKDQSASYKAKSLGKNKVKYFNALSKKYGPDQALKKLVREDGSSKTLKQLQKTYTKTPSKKLAAKSKLVDWDAVSKSPKTKAALEESKKLSEKLSKATSVASLSKQIAKQQQKDLAKVVKAKKIVPKVKGAEKATLQKLDASTKNNLKNFKEADLSKPNHQKWFTNQKAFNSNLIPKGKYDTITPKELGKLVEKKEIAKLQQKYDKAFKKSLLPAKPVKPRAPLKKWDDPSFIQKNIGSTDTKTPPPPRKALRNGKKKTDDLYWKSDNKNAVKNYDMSVAQLKDAEEQISNWTGDYFYDIRAVQIKQAQSVGKQLNPNELRLLNERIRDNKFMTNAQVGLVARNADKMERYIANSPKWNGPTRFINETDKLHKNPFYTKQPNGTIYRGMTVHKKSIVDEVVNNMKRGEAVSTMESWSTSPRTALKFAKGEIGDGNHGIVFRHVNKYGTPIEHLNGMNESEILQPSGVRYKVISKKTKNWKEPLEEGGPKTVEYSMTEVVLQAI
tara:strand:+ start:2410 stop:4932 length:2523 start_codon:yes stop_codon:yes gene_type:complete